MFLLAGVFLNLVTYYEDYGHHPAAFSVHLTL